MLAHVVPNCSSVAMSHCLLLSHTASPQQSPCLLQPGALQALAVPREVWGASGPSAGSIRTVCPSSRIAGSCSICFGVNHEFLEPQFP